MQEMQEMQVQSLGQEEPLEQEMAPHSDILAWKIPWSEEPGGLQSMGLHRVGHSWVTKHTHILFPILFQYVLSQSIVYSSLGQEDPLEQEMAPHSDILAWKIPWTEEPGGLQSMGLQSWTQLSD